MPNPPEPIDELQLEIELDRLSAALAGDDPPRWNAARRRVITQALQVSGLRTLAAGLLQWYAPQWIEHEPAVAAARLAPPSWSAYRRLRAAQDAISDELFGAPWIDVMRWHQGVPSASADPLPAPAAIPAITEGWTTGSLPLPWRPLIARWQRELTRLAERDVVIDVTFSAARPHAQVHGPRVELFLRDERDMPRAWFQLLHELGHAVAALAGGGAVPRAVDEAVAAWLARHLEEEDSAPGLPVYATAPALHAAERARRAAVAGALAHLESQLHAGAGDQDQPQAQAQEGAAGLPWALWHDAGAQVAYLHAETLAETWWQRGLRITSSRAALTAAVAEACAQAMGLPHPFPKLQP